MHLKMGNVISNYIEAGNVEQSMIEIMLLLFEIILMQIVCKSSIGFKLVYD